MNQLIMLVYVLSAFIFICVLYSFLCSLGVLLGAPSITKYFFECVLFNPFDYLPSVSIHAPKRGFGTSDPALDTSL